MYIHDIVVIWFHGIQIFHQVIQIGHLLMQIILIKTRLLNEKSENMVNKQIIKI